MALLRSHNHRARKKFRVEPPLKYTIEDMTRAMEFVKNYSMGSRKLSEHISQKDAEALKQRWSEASPTLSRMYREMHDRMQGRRDAES